VGRTNILLAGFVKCQCGTSIYIYSKAKKFTCKNSKNNISVKDMDDVSQQVLKSYLNDVNPQVYLEEIMGRLKDKEVLLVESVKKRT
jgi:site-specific DNA recombinase